MHSYYQQKHPFSPPFVGPITPININSFQDGRFHPTNQPIPTTTGISSLDTPSRFVNPSDPEEYRHSSTPEGQRILLDFNAGITVPVSLAIQHKCFSLKSNVFLKTDVEPVLDDFRQPLRFSRHYNQIFDEDAIAYIAAVEAADGQRLEYQIQEAIQEFIVGCKLDPSPNSNVSNWAAIKASCLLAGPRTLSGILVPLKGTAPTNVNFVSGDYNRIIGLKGNGINKRLASNRLNNADPQDNRSLYVYVTDPSTLIANANVYIGTTITTGLMAILRDSTNVNNIVYRPSASIITRTIQNGGVGGLGLSRNSSTNIDILNFSSFEGGIANTSTTHNSLGISIFSATSDRFNDPRISFYSIGESVNLQSLDSRISTYMNRIASIL